MSILELGQNYFFSQFREFGHRVPFFHSSSLTYYEGLDPGLSPGLLYKVFR